MRRSSRYRPGAWPGWRHRRCRYCSWRIPNSPRTIHLSMLAPNARRGGRNAKASLMAFCANGLSMQQSLRS
jgi:hypothetical protein